MASNKEWKQAQVFEKGWHERVSTNTFHEEEKQMVYAKRMGLEFCEDAYTPYNLQASGRILDIGGGETSLLLKIPGQVDGMVVDPCTYPEWAMDRYEGKGITFINWKAEDIPGDPETPDIFGKFDECWIYNCLQHTEKPELIIKRARERAKIIRIFEWIDTPTNEGHIHTLTEAKLNEWLGGVGKVEELAEHGCFGRCYYGIFLGDTYESKALL